MAKIALGVASSISIYKACEVLRGFQKKEIEVQVIMTRNAARLVSPLLFSALSRAKTVVDPFEESSSETIAHIALAREISLLLVAPATANVIAKFAAGIADDFLSTFFLAVECPVLIAPAMNEAMYHHPQTQANIEKLKARGLEFIEPDKGYLACREEGWGRLADPEAIVEEGMRLVRRTQSLRGKTVLVTAGPTREPLDPIRFLSNRSSGKMGYALASEAAARGAQVILVSGPVHLVPPAKAKVIQVQTAGEMAQEIEKFFAAADAVIMTAAVADFRFPVTFPQKIKKNDLPARLELIRTVDILKTLGRKKKGKILVGFAAETENVVANARKKMKEKNLDLIVANDIAEPGIGFESDYNQASLVESKGGVVQTPKLSKIALSRAILDRIEVLLGKKT